MITELSERQVVDLWQRLLTQRRELTTEEGESIKIVYPGRSNKERGADFRDVVIATNRGLKRGDVEVHIRSSAWRAHRHHCNPAYNQSILHVVMWHDTKTATNLQNGGSIPIVALNRYVEDRGNQHAEAKTPASSNWPCLKVKARGCPSTIITQFLNRAGEERFLAKTNRFQDELAQMEAGQCLYQGIMAALGYSQNKLAFLELARRVPLHLLQSTVRLQISDEERLVRQQALLLGAGGLLPSQCPHGRHSDDSWIDKLERLWSSCHEVEAMPISAWHMFRVRPNNSPIRRLVAMSYLILRYRERGILNGLMDMVMEAPVNRSHHRLEAGLVVTARGYWASHFDFASVTKTRSPTLLGNRRAADIIVNVLLPFAAAWGRLTSQLKLERKAVDLYRHYPKLAANSIEQHMRNQLGVSSNLVNSARQQQGLIHIYNTLCTQGRCHCCPLT